MSAYHPSTWEVEAGWPSVSKFKTKLGYVKHCLKKLRVEETVDRKPPNKDRNRGVLQM